MPPASGVKTLGQIIGYLLGVAPTSPTQKSPQAESLFSMSCARTAACAPPPRPPKLCFRQTAASALARRSRRPPRARGAPLPPNCTKPTGYPEQNARSAQLHTHHKSSQAAFFTASSPNSPRKRLIALGSHGGRSPNIPGRKDCQTGARPARNPHPSCCFKYSSRSWALIGRRGRPFEIGTGLDSLPRAKQQPHRTLFPVQAPGGKHGPQPPSIAPPARISASTFPPCIAPRK